MPVQVGNAAAPRWFDCSLDRLDAYVEFLQVCGATSTELVLHRGPADDRIAGVHVLESDWMPVFERFRAAGIVCHAHAPLSPSFGLDTWLGERDVLKENLRPVARAVAHFAEQQRTATVLVIHAASSAPGTGTRATKEAIEWLLAETETQSGSVRIAIELRRASSVADLRVDRDRSKLASFVELFAGDRFGICWDIANDWQTFRLLAKAPTIPDASFLRLVHHVHLHDVGRDDLDAHHPLNLEHVPWRAMLGALIGQGFAGAVTMEIRYRHALEQGDPWTVLADSYERLNTFLAEPSQST